MTRRIEIQTKTSTSDAFNQPIESWSTVSTIWAEITTTGGGEFYAAQKLHASTQALFKVRYDSSNKTITTKARIKYGSRIFEILNINNVDEANQELNISAKEVI